MAKLHLFILVSIVLATACKPRDEKRETIKAEMSAFEKDWAATGEMLATWGLELDSRIKFIEKDTLESRMDDSTRAACLALKPTYEAAMEKWWLHQKAYTDWKKMFDDGIVKTSDALKSLKEFKDVLEKYNGLLGQWGTQLDECRPGAAKGRI